jgi:hypothetical protein
MSPNHSHRDSGLFTTLVAEALTTGAVVRFSAEGTSMHPAISDGDVITIAAVSPDEVVRGDVLLYRNDKRVLAHRVVEVTTRGVERVFRLRGDARDTSDPPVGAEAVVGKVISVSRDGRAAPWRRRARRLRRPARTAASGAKALIVSAVSVFREAVWPDAISNRGIMPMLVPSER